MNRIKESISDHSLYEEKPLHDTLKEASEDHTEKYNPGEFPIDVLSLPMQVISKEFAFVHQMPAALPGMTALAVVSGAIGKTYRVIGASYQGELFGNVYVVACAKKSTGKGNASLLARPLLQASKEMAEDWKKNKLPKMEIQAKILEMDIKNWELYT